MRQGFGRVKVSGGQKAGGSIFREQDHLVVHRAVKDMQYLYGLGFDAIEDQKIR